MIIKELINTMPQIGKVEWIGIRPSKKAELEFLRQCSVTEEHGLIGDHYQGRSRKRQVTLIQSEHLEVVGHILKRKIQPELCRRNLVISGINLLALKDHKIKIGDQVILEITGLCHPCTRMEENLGEGGYNAMRGHGGVTASVIQGGQISLLDPVSLILDQNILNE